MPVDVAKKFMNKANPKDTGMMHGMLAVHLGMKTRLLEALDIKKGLVKDAEGVVVNVLYHPLDQDHVDAAMASRAERIYLEHLPLVYGYEWRSTTRALSSTTILEPTQSGSFS